MQFETININNIHPAEYNPRIMPQEEMKKLKTGLNTFGLVDPIIIDLTDDNTVIGGHQRLEVLKEIDDEMELQLIRLGDIGLVIKETELKIKDKNDQKALNLALNKISGTWDYKKLDDVLLELSEENYNLELTGFDGEELIDIPNDDFDFDLNINENEIEQEKHTKNDDFYYFSTDEIKEDIINEYYVPENLDEYASWIITPSVAKYQFNRLCQGYNDGYYISFLFNKHRLTTKTIGHKISLWEAMHTDGYIKDFARYVSQYEKTVPNPQLYKFIRIGHSGYQYVNEFPPYLARDIYKHYTKEGDKILNPCAGWGGRLIGLASCLYKDVTYIETDTNKQTVQGLQKLKQFLHLDENNYKTYNQPFEELELQENYFDFTFTSPPYFDTERYGGEKTSYEGKEDYEQWKTEFLEVMLDKIMYSLKPKATCLLNVGKNRYPIDEDVIHYIEKEYKIPVKRVDKYRIGGHGIGSRTGEGGEPFLEFTKK